MRDKRQQVNDAVLNLIRASNSQDQVFVVNFGQNPYLDQDFTSDVKSAASGVASSFRERKHRAVRRDCGIGGSPGEQLGTEQESSVGDHGWPGQT